MLKNRVFDETIKNDIIKRLSDWNALLETVKTETLALAHETLDACEASDLKTLAQRVNENIPRNYRKMILKVIKYDFVPLSEHLWREDAFPSVYNQSSQHS